MRTMKRPKPMTRNTRIERLAKSGCLLAASLTLALGGEALTPQMWRLIRRINKEAPRVWPKG